MLQSRGSQSDTDAQRRNVAEKPLVPGMPLALSGHNGITSDLAHKEGLLELLRALCFDSTHTIMIFMLVVV